MHSTMVSAEFSSTLGAVQVLLNNSNINGLQNTVLQYQTANTLSVPLPGNMIVLDKESAAQMQVIGYNSRILDSNYSILPGEFTAYSTSWYSSVRNGGVEVQQANTTNKENLMAGQSTNSVLSDILSIIIDIITYLGTHTHSGVQTGTGDTGTVVTPPPNDTDIIDDQTYINGNKNLFITGTYVPK